MDGACGWRLEPVRSGVVSPPPLPYTAPSQATVRSPFCVFVKWSPSMPITPLMPVYPRCAVRPVRGEGVYLYGERGEQYLDFAAGIAVNALGHGHAHLTKV